MEDLPVSARIEKTLRQDPALQRVMQYGIENFEAAVFGSQGEPEANLVPDLDAPSSFVREVGGLIATQFEDLQTRNIIISHGKLIMNMALPEHINPHSPDRLLVPKGERVPEYLISVVKRPRIGSFSNDPARVISSAGYLIEIARQDVYFHPRLESMAFNRTHGFQIELGEDGRMVVKGTKYDGAYMYAAYPMAVNDSGTVKEAIRSLDAMNVF